MRALPCRLIMTALFNSDTHPQSADVVTSTTVRRDNVHPHTPAQLAWHTLPIPTRSLTKLRYTTQPAKALLLARHARQPDTSPQCASNQEYPVGSHKQLKFIAYMQRCLLLHSVKCPAAPSTSPADARSGQAYHTSSFEFNSCQGPTCRHAKAPCARWLQHAVRTQ
jgi:hypothetical protein